MIPCALFGCEEKKSQAVAEADTSLLASFHSAQRYNIGCCQKSKCLQHIWVAALIEALHLGGKS